ncbi:MAG: formylmethanofuran--tetrahydromethanopterin formyltransferase [bacterium]|nr:MAG: formylmethanofuran--tetrahydromethanopterin formyltransferase [bacterium]
MKINSVIIDDVHAEAFESAFARLVVTARSGGWVGAASQAAVGCATSVIGCGCEAGIEALRGDFKTPDGRPGHELLFFAKTKEKLQRELIKRVGQTLLPAPTVMVFNGLENGDDFPLGTKVGYFGNGFEKVENRHGRECVVVPITSGEFVVEKTVRIAKGVAGANFWVFASSYKAGLKAAEKAVLAISPLPGVILPFAGGVTASASRMGSRYPFLNASTQEDFCSAINAQKNPNTRLPDGVEAVFEIIIDAVSLKAAKEAMAKGIRAACVGGVVKIGAASFGGNLGGLNIRLRELFET